MCVCAHGILLRRRYASSVATRQYAHHQRGHGAVRESSVTKVGADNRLLHVDVDFAEDYHHLSSSSCADSDYATFTPTKAKQVSQTF